MITFYQFLLIIASFILFLAPISLIAYILIVIKRKKKRAFDDLGKIDDAEIEQIFVEHRGIKIPIRRRELPMWNKMHREDKNALLAAFLNISKKGKIFKDGDSWKKLIKSK